MWRGSLSLRDVICVCVVLVPVCLNVLALVLRQASSHSRQAPESFWERVCFFLGGGLNLRQVGLLYTYRECVIQAVVDCLQFENVEIAKGGDISAQQILKWPNAEMARREGYG